MFSQNKTTKLIFQKQAYKTNPQNKSFKKRYTKRIHETNLLKTGLQNKSIKQIFWKQYGFANPKPRICVDFSLFKVCLCTKDLSGFMRICWIRENRSNLLKIILQNESTNWIFKDRTRKSRFENLWSRICQSRNKMNLFGVRIYDHDTKRIHIFTNLL